MKTPKPSEKPVSRGGVPRGNPREPFLRAPATFRVCDPWMRGYAPRSPSARYRVFMQRPGMDPDNAKPEDFLCDFCRGTWSEERPMVEGHRGSLICGKCLTLAYDSAWNTQSCPRLTATCTLCLEEKEDVYWQSPAYGDAFACKRCIKQSVVMLERDPDTRWERPR